MSTAKKTISAVDKPSASLFGSSVSVGMLALPGALVPIELE